jgi:hypothetical protein
MKPEQVIEWADKSGYLNLPVSMRGMELAELTRFAELVAQHEREENAKVCEGRIGGAVKTNEWWNGFRSAMNQCAAAIRARGQKGGA